MLKILIADDEYFIRERLKQLVDYRALGYELSGEAANGEKAWQLITEQAPDLAILDIKMPLLSGLEIAQRIYEKQLDTKVIILTSYDYFSYAQESIHYGVSAYLLKPVDRLMLTDVLSDIAGKICSERRLQNMAGKYQTEKQANAFLDYLLGELRDHEEMLLLDELAQSFPKDLPPTLLLLKLENKDGEPSIASGLPAVIREQQIFHDFYFFSYTDNICGLLVFQPSRAKLQSRLYKLSGCILEELTRDFVIVTGHPAVEFSCLPGEFQALAALIRHSVFLKMNRLYWLEECGDITGSPKRFLCSFREPLLVCLRSGNHEKACAVITQALCTMAKEAPSAYNLSIVLSEFFLSCSIYKNEIQASPGNDNAFYVHELTENYLTLEDITEWCRSFLSSLCRSPRPTDHASPNILVTKVTDLIESSFSDPGLDLSYIADKTGYTASYLSSTFKKITGFSIVQYITKYRMEEARNLLCDSSLKLRDICCRIGYTDVFYFSKRFKSYFGHSPSDYMKRN